MLQSCTQRMIPIDATWTGIKICLLLSVCHIFRWQKYMYVKQSMRSYQSQNYGQNLSKIVNCGTPSANWPVRTRCWVDCEGEASSSVGHTFLISNKNNSGKIIYRSEFVEQIWSSVTQQNQRQPTQNFSNFLKKLGKRRTNVSGFPWYLCRKRNVSKWFFKIMQKGLKTFGIH